MYALQHRPRLAPIPLSLTLTRLGLGPVAILLAFADAPRGCFSGILIAGLFTDYFDGVIARRLGVARPWLRRLDSAVDVAFYLSIAAAAYLLERQTTLAAVFPLSLLIAAEFAIAGVSLVRFHSLPATHCHSAKLYGIILFIRSTGILTFSWGPWALWLSAGFGWVANLECLGLLVQAKESPIDIPGLWHFRTATRQVIPAHKSTRFGSGHRAS